MTDRRDTAELFTLADLAGRLAEEPPPPADDSVDDQSDDGLDERGEEAPPPDSSRRVRPFVFVAAAAVVLGLSAVVLLQPHETTGTPVARQPAPAAPSTRAPVSTDPITTLSASAPPFVATARLDHTTAETTDVPAGAGRKPAQPPPPSDAESWRDLLSSVISSWENAPPRHGPPHR